MLNLLSLVLEISSHSLDLVTRTRNIWSRSLDRYFERFISRALNLLSLVLEISSHSLDLITRMLEILSRSLVLIPRVLDILSRALEILSVCTKYYLEHSTCIIKNKISVKYMYHECTSIHCLVTNQWVEFTDRVCLITIYIYKRFVSDYLMYFN